MIRDELRELARLYSIQLSYEDAEGKRREASRDSLLAALAVRVPGGLQDVESALRARRSELARRLIDPVIVAWGGRAVPVVLRIPMSRADERLSWELELESGETRGGSFNLAAAAIQRVEEHHAQKTVLLPAVPFGYHTLRVMAGGHSCESALFSAPMRAPAAAKRGWGVFAPVYAMRTEHTGGIGDLGDLRQFQQWVGELGGDFVATLPLNAIFAEEDPSPYAPVSRLFWNELYLDVSRLPEYRGEEIAAHGSALRLDYEQVQVAKRSVLEQLASRFEPDAEFQRFAREATAYAEFRARHELGQRAESGNGGGEAACAIPLALETDDRVRYHLYVQYRLAQQMREIATETRERGSGLYLDFPLGVHARGYDVWHYAAHFAQKTSVGSPPDLFFTRGQNWGFPPPDPDAIRQQHYTYYRACIRRQMEHAAVLRIDHVMGLHRLFWIPEGADAADGVYVRYPHDELYAVMLIEAQRSGTVIVGEDLGTVPVYVPREMRNHGVRRMYVVQYEIQPEGDEPAGRPVAEAVASVNTHDMPTFAGFWQGRDIGDRLSQDLLDGKGAENERTRRAAMRESLTRFLTARGLLNPSSKGPISVLDALLRYLASSEAEMVLVNLEDLWLEEEPQNVPGVPERSWRQRLRRTLGELRGDPGVTQMLRSIDATRRKEHGNQKQKERGLSRSLPGTDEARPRGG